MGRVGAPAREPGQPLDGCEEARATLGSAVAAITFMVVAWGQIDWLVALLIGVGAFAGGIVGAKVGRRLPPLALRGVIIAVGIVGIIKIVWVS
jgi:uncharacterized membrane protein YfcA